jgi:hypothetical protein
MAKKKTTTKTDDYQLSDKQQAIIKSWMNNDNRKDIIKAVIAALPDEYERKDDEKDGKYNQRVWISISGIVERLAGEPCCIKLPERHTTKDKIPKQSVMVDYLGRLGISKTEINKMKVAKSK